MSASTFAPTYALFDTFPKGDLGFNIRQFGGTCQSRSTSAGSCPSPQRSRTETSTPPPELKEPAYVEFGCSPFTSRSCDTAFAAPPGLDGFLFGCADGSGGVSPVPINAPTAFTPDMVSAALSAVADGCPRQGDADIARNIFIDALVGRPLTHDWTSSKTTDVSPRPAPGLSSVAPKSMFRAPPGLALVPLGLQPHQSVPPGLERINLGQIQLASAIAAPVAPPRVRAMFSDARGSKTSTCPPPPTEWAPEMRAATPPLPPPLMLAPLVTGLPYPPPAHDTALHQNTIPPPPMMAPSLSAACPPPPHSQAPAFEPGCAPPPPPRTMAPDVKIRCPSLPQWDAAVQQVSLAQLCAVCPPPPQWAPALEQFVVPPPPTTMAASCSTELLLLSVGSADHIAGNCRPCAFLYAKGCENGTECGFCHLCGPAEIKRRRHDKKRQMRQLNRTGSNKISP